MCILALCFAAFLLIRCTLAPGDCRAGLPESVRDGTEAQGFGRVSKIEVRGDTSNIYLDDFLLISKSEEYQLKTIIFKTNESEEYDYGSTLYITGRVCFFESAGNPGQFDTAGYYRSLG